MVENENIEKLYEELEQAIQKGAHEEVENLSQKILNKNPSEKEATHCKIVSLISLGKSKDLESFINSIKKENEYVLEFAYSLYDTGNYLESIQHLNKNKKNNPVIESGINTLLAQNYNKLGEYKKSFELYKEIILERQDNLENESDLLTNFLAVYALSNANEPELLKKIEKYLNSWECFYNYALIFLYQKIYNECLITMKKYQQDFNEDLDEFNLLKDKYLRNFILQNLFEGFDMNKVSNLSTEVEILLKENSFKKNENFPYFYNNYLNIRKDVDSFHEVLKKLDTFIQNPKFSPLERKILIKNKINFLIRGNKLVEASELLNKTLEDETNQSDLDFLIMKSYFYYKNEKEKFENYIDEDKILQNKIGPQIFILQILLSNLTMKNFEHFHYKLMSFVNNFREISLNLSFILFFIGFYSSKKQNTYLKEFLNKFINPEELYEKNQNPQEFKNFTIKISESFYKMNEYQFSAKFCEYYLNKVDHNDKEIKILFIQSLSHDDLSKGEDLRRGLDENTIDLGNEHMNNLLNEFFTKFRKVGDKQKKIEKKKKKKKIRYPKNFNPKEPGPMPDPERWLPKLQRKKYRSLQKNKLAYQGASADNKTTTAQKFK